MALKLKLKCTKCNGPVMPTEDAWVGNMDNTFSGLCGTEIDGVQNGEYFLNLDGWTCKGITDAIADMGPGVDELDGIVTEHEACWQVSVTNTQNDEISWTMDI